MPASCAQLIDDFLAELRCPKPRDRQFDRWRRQLLQQGDAYVFPLLAKIRAAAGEREAIELAVLVQMLADPRLIEPLRGLMDDRTASQPGRAAAATALQCFGIAPADDVLPASANAEAELGATLDELLEQVTHDASGAMLHALPAMLVQTEPKMMEALLAELARRQGAKALPVLTYLAEQADPILTHGAATALALVPHSQSRQILERLRAQPTDAATHDRAAQSLALLEQQPMPAPGPQDDLPATPPVERWQIERAELSNVDGMGSRMVTFLCQINPRKLASIHLCLNDVVGVKDCMGGDGQRKRIERQLTEMRAMMPEEILWAEAEADYCLGLVQEARRLNLKSHFPLPAGYHSWISPLGYPRRRFARPLIYEELDADSRQDWREDAGGSEVLYDVPGMGWIFDFRDVRPVVDKARSAHSGDWTKIPDALIDEVISAACTLPLRRLWQRRLEENGFVLARHDSTRTVAQCLAIARALREAPEELATVGYLRIVAAQSVWMTLDVLDGVVDLNDVERSPFEPIV